MKHRHKLRRLGAVLLALALCCAGLTAQAEDQPFSRQETAQATMQDHPSTSSSEEDETSQPWTPAPTSSPAEDPESSSSPEEGASPSPSPDEDPETSQPATPPPSPTPDPEVNYYSVTFNMGILGGSTEKVAEGEIPPLVPWIGELPHAEILGWFDEQGNQVDPETTPVTRDVTYTARWSRNVEELLNTEDHVTYVSGYESGLFLPEKTITRAEAASMFYKLLRSVDWEPRTFSDVKSTAWYAEAVEALAGLGILSGYEDGTFGPDKEITRAEFVAIAVAFSALEDGQSSFSDVKPGFWAASHIYTASKLGWISGFTDGTFAPNDPVKRCQAVSIINKMLGRSAPENVKELTDVKSFYDLFPSHWAYGAIVEAAAEHTYHTVPAGEESTEVWDSYAKDEGAVESHWIREIGNLYYVDGATKKVLRGSATIGDTQYLFDSSTGAACNGFYTQGQWRRYYRDGALQEDISELGVVSGPYFIQVYKPSNYLIIFAKDPATGAYNTPVQAMRVSCGVPTPTGTYYTPARYRWLKMVGDTWAQWCTQIQGNYLFHSVPNWTRNNLDLEVGEYNQLGNTRSLGCIRLNCEDAKWIYDNCGLGTQVNISATMTSGPLEKPEGLQIPIWHTWDPTDPTATYMCDQHGCHQWLK